MTRYEKLATALSAIKLLAPIIRATGQHHPAGSSGPSHWVLDWHGHRLLLAERALLWPDDSALSSLLDIWPDTGPKLLSVRWQPLRPWVPPEIVAFRAGDWIDRIQQESQPEP